MLTSGARRASASFLVAALASCGGTLAPANGSGPTPAARIDPSAPIAPADYSAAITTRRQALLDRGLGLLTGDVGYYMDVQEARLRQLGGSALRLTRREQSVILELPGPLSFESGKADLAPGARGVLADVSRVLADYRFTIISVSGHTDDSGDAALNKTLSEQRAGAVAQQLIAGGVEADRIVVVGYGPARPIGDNTTETGREANRRVVLRIDPLKR